MKPNLLDDLFKNQLKDQGELPQGITFRKEKVLASINTRIIHTSNNRKWLKYVAVVLLFILSGYWHWLQRQEINHQKQLLAEQNDLIHQNRSEANRMFEQQRAFIDSVKNSAVSINYIGKVASLPSLPATMVQHKLVIAPTMIVHIAEPINISDKKIPNHKSPVPELDLPVYYESERLASNTNEASKGRSFKRKLSELFNN